MGAFTCPGLGAPRLRSDIAPRSQAVGQMEGTEWGPGGGELSPRLCSHRRSCGWFRRLRAGATGADGARSPASFPAGSSLPSHSDATRSQGWSWGSAVRMHLLLPDGLGH